MARGRGRPKKKVPPLLNQPLVQNAEGESSTVGTQLKGEGETEKQIFEEATPTKPAATLTDNQPTPGKKLWVDVISGNRLPANGMAITFIAPNVVEGEAEVAIEQEDIESEVLYWETTLIMYVIGKYLSMNAVKQFMNRSWNHVQQPEIYYHEGGYFLLRFNSHDRDAILTRGPYSIQNSPMVLKEWTTDFDFQRDMLRILPIWVKLPNLPLSLWGPKSLSEIGSALGTPLFTDECTARKLWVSYARILVEIDITQKPKESISVKDEDGKKFNQVVELEWKPKFYDECQQIGHQCTSKVVKKWIVKPPEPIPNIVEKNTPQKQHEVNPNGLQETHQEIPWSMVKGSIKGKGQIPLSMDGNVICQNGFESLGVGEPIVILEKGA